ncbi:MAG: 16S rRNA (guanine(966)-N(2))-methyltransferase RsmD [Eubacteriales bacterium]|nr:16S rRNA (guanine(966)-N(2))-methyltransferase RsmD [Eubacteriales bacterium]
MRIVSGRARGTRLYSPKNDRIRPTSDKIKESIFNILQPIKPDALVLDLFAGTGGIGLEFVSRGAQKVYFVDNSRESVDLIRKNIAKCRFEDQSVVMNLDFEMALSVAKRDNLKFDYIFIDPPYAAFKSMQLLDKIFDSKLMSDGGVIVLEVEKDERLEFNNTGVSIKEKIYGRTKIILITGG